MKIAIKKLHLIAALGRERAQILVPEIIHRDEGERVSLNIYGVPNDELDKIQRICATENRPLARRMAAWRDLREDPEGKPVITAMQMEVGLISYMLKRPHRMLFERSEDGQMLPYFVTGIQYHEAERHKDRDTGHVWWTPPYVTMSLRAFKEESQVSTTVTFHAGDKDGTGGEFGEMTIQDLLEKNDLFPEREKSYARYEAELAKFHAVYRQTGAQYLGEGRCYGKDDDEWSSSRYRHNGRRAATTMRSLTRDNRPSRVVIDWHGDEQPDEENDNAVDVGAYSDKFWRKHEVIAGIEEKIVESVQPINSAEDLAEADEEPEDEEGTRTVILPVHPYLQVFDFESGSFMTCHVNCLTEYPFAKDIQEKLILPANTKDLVSILIGTARTVAQDIVAGKSGGVIVMSTGLPGTGKTLTAEVFAEEMRIPIYMVQCSQLGTSVDALKEKLQLVLKRAVRWNALLLLDEADVYVRQRGDDLEQNAIVGVFLVLLERFNGILFMTSNRPEEIDDAILSRCIAHIRYGLPNAEEARRIWSVLSDNYDVPLTPMELKRLPEEFPHISGRNIKTLLKLATAVSKKDKFVKGEVVELIKKVAPFVDFTKAHYTAIAERKKS